MSENKKSKFGKPTAGGPGMMIPGGKAKDFKGTIKRLASYLKPQLLFLILVVIFAVFGTIFGVYGPKQIGRATTHVGYGYMQKAVYHEAHQIMPADIKLPENANTEDLKEIMILTGKLLQAQQTGEIVDVPGKYSPAVTEMVQLVSQVYAVDASVKAGNVVWKDLSEDEQDTYLSVVPDNLKVTAEYWMDNDILASFNPENTEALEESAYRTNDEEAIMLIKQINFADPVPPEMNFDAIWNILSVMILLYIVSAIFSFIQGILMVWITQKTVFKMRSELSDKVNRLPIQYFDATSHGDTLSIVTNDIDNIATTLQQSATQLLTSIVTIVGVLIMMISINLTLTFITILSIPVYFGLTLLIAKRSQKEFISNQTELGKINGIVEEMYSGQKVVKAYCYEEKAINEFDKVNERLYNSTFKSQYISGLIMPVLTIVGNFVYVVVCVVGATLSGSGNISVGSIQSFIMYSQQFSQPIFQAANLANLIQSTAASAERVFELLDQPEEVVDEPDAITIFDPKGNVAFKNVKFGYSEDKILMNNLDIEVKSGQTIAVVGPTGAGKTTMVNLLMRFYEIADGNITIDGTCITDIKRSSLRSVFGMVLQDTWLFNGTIRENISYAKEDATEAEIVEASKAAYVDRFVRTLSDGYDTVLNEEASNISQGQKQLITIARAILAQPSILILDEATSSVDTRTEVQIQKAMNKLASGRTTFIIAHRLSTIKGADKILVMNKGDIIEQGTHEELLEAKGFYHDLYSSQFSGPAITDEDLEKADLI